VYELEAAPRRRRGAAAGEYYERKIRPGRLRRNPVKNERSTFLAERLFSNQGGACAPVEFVLQGLEGGADVALDL
jgi:hypothetical protein